ncbi:glycoside hydrolase superfamily [Camillea tinctor]|nr:glycoside hydrolase superfamily [Camillea tinctor]
MRDPNAAPAGIRWGPMFQNELSIGLKPNSKRSGESSETMTSIEKLRFMASLTWDDIKDWGNAYDISVNGTEMYQAATTFSGQGNFALGENMLDMTQNMTSIGRAVSRSNGIIEYSRSDTPQNNFTTINETTGDFVKWSTSAVDLGTLSDSYLRGGHQNFATRDGPVHIIDMGTEYILGNVAANLEKLGASDSSLEDANQHNSSSQTTQGLQDRGSGKHPNEGFSLITPLHKRDGPVQCGPDSPCVDDSCCNTDGKCGFKDAHCGNSCISNCNATAMCGVDSADGQTSCALNLCCSYYGWCGTESVHCYDPEPQYGVTPCQGEFGSCFIYPEPSCSGNSASARRIAYYQGWNVRERLCDKVSPAQINTQGLTHLFYAFIFFHPTTFQITPMNDADVEQYAQFTSLSNNKLQTWAAIGGWSFSDPGPTQTAWSDMVSSAANRAVFISSLVEFMETYGFQGADLDWEYPVEEDRGGRKEDADNLVLLVQEARAAFGSRFGLSLTLAPDYWYMRGFKPSAMEPYVDFMGFMAYDLHGPWDTDVEALGSIVRPHTDITEIRHDLKPLWFDGVSPSKINMGIAYYGRTYTLEDASCGEMNSCRFTGPGAPGECTAFDGVLSNREIRAMIEKEGYKPYLNETAMVKYFTYGGNSWVGYDDEETFVCHEREIC